MFFINHHHHLLQVIYNSLSDSLFRIMTDYDVERGLLSLHSMPYSSFDLSSGFSSSRFHVLIFFLFHMFALFHDQAMDRLVIILHQGSSSLRRWQRISSLHFDAIVLAKMYVSEPVIVIPPFHDINMHL